MLRSVAVAALLAGATAAWADSIEEKAALCGACHGVNGVPEDPTTPIIWGQNAGYLYLQFRDFQKGARKDYRMTPIAQFVVKTGRAGARRIFRRQALAEDRGAQRLQSGHRDCDDGDQLGGVHQLPLGAVPGRFIHSAARRPGTRLSRQDDDRFPDSHPRQQSRHDRPDTHRHARTANCDRRLFGGALESKPNRALAPVGIAAARRRRDAPPQCGNSGSRWMGSALEQERGCPQSAHKTSVALTPRLIEPATKRRTNGIRQRYEIAVTS